MRFKILAKIITFVFLAIPVTLSAAPGITLLTEDTPPVNYLDENQQPAGLSVELVREMARRVGDPGKIKIVPWARGYKDVQERDDVALFSTAWSPERDPTFQWVGPLLTKEVVLYQKKGSTISINTIDDAIKVGRIGTYKDDSKEQLLRKLGFINLDSALDDTANPKKLLAGRIDLWISSSIQSAPTCKLAGIDPNLFEPVITLKKQLMYLVFPKQASRDDVGKWQRALDDMKQEGFVDKVYAKYDLPKSSDAMTIYTENVPPRNYLENGQVTGYLTEIVRQILRRTGETSRIKLVSWARGYQEALERPNVALFGTGRSVDRENFFHWVGPIGRTNIAFYAKKGSGITIASLDDAKKVKSIGTYKNDVKEQFLKSQGFTNLESVVDDPINAKKLVHGRIDLWVSAEDSAGLKALDAGIDPAEIEKVYTIQKENRYIAFSKTTNFSIVSQWQDALDDMHKDGSFERILHKWNVAW